APPERALRSRRRARDPARRIPAGDVPRRCRRGEGARGDARPLPEGPRAAQVVRPSGRRAGERVPPRRAYGLPARRARRAPPHAAGGRRRVAARLPESALRPALRPLALGRPPSRREGVPLGARAPARSRATSPPAALTSLP